MVSNGSPPLQSVPSCRLFGKCQHMTSAEWLLLPGSRASRGCFPSFCHTFFLGSGPASTFPTGAHSPVCSDLVAGVCTVDQLPVSVLSPPAPSRAQPAASGTGWEVKTSFRSPKFQAVCRIPCGRQGAGL